LTVLGFLVVCAGPVILLAGVSGYVPDDDKQAVIVTGEDDRCTRVRMLVTVPGRTPFTTSHLIDGEQIIDVGTNIPVDVHPARDLFRLAADSSTDGATR
jgi:hypothetical protein